jgi:chromate transport protein ChrA
MENDQPHWASTILYSLAWLICCLLVIVDILAIREASLDVLTAIQAQRIAAAPEGEAVAEQINIGFAIQALDQGLLFFGGIVAVVIAIGLEYYFRMGQRQGKLLRRISMVVGIQIAIFVICVVIQTLV